MKKHLTNALIRGVIPFAIMTTIALIMRSQNVDSFQVKSTFMVGLIVTAVAAASVIYDVEKWSLSKQSGIHFLIMLVTVFPCLLLSGWFPLNSFLDYLKVFGIFVLVGAVLWSVFYFIFGKLLTKKDKQKE
jgi:threonine/homoserine efflux transporter RhtA